MRSQGAHGSWLLPLDPLPLQAFYTEHHSWLLDRLIARVHHREDAVLEWDLPVAPLRR